MSGRIFDNWIEGYCEWTKDRSAPPIFGKWAAIAAIAGALERKVWLRNRIGVLYPNLYTFLVAPPGIGKTIHTDLVWGLWDDLEDHKIALPSVTYASLADELRDAERHIIRPGENPSVVQFNSLLIAINELEVFLPAYEGEMMSRLTDLYDCKHYGERRRHNEKLNFSLRHVQLNILAACPPAYLRNTLPEGAWDAGFISRTIMIFSGEQVIDGDLFASEAEDALYTEQDDERNKLLADLRYIGKELFGKVRFTQAAADLITTWRQEGGPPRPNHPKLAHYCTRRVAHALKLAMVASVAEGDELVIEEHHMQTAIGWLIEAEANMPDIFRVMAVSGDSQVIEETWHFCYSVWVRERKPILKYRVVEFIRERTHAHNVLKILEVMIACHMLSETLDTNGPAFKVKPMKD